MDLYAQGLSEDVGGCHVGGRARDACVQGRFVSPALAVNPPISIHSRRAARRQEEESWSK